MDTVVIYCYIFRSLVIFMTIGNILRAFDNVVVYITYITYSPLWQTCSQVVINQRNRKQVTSGADQVYDAGARGRNRFDKFTRAPEN
jgi:hypothetical protein